MTSIVGGLDVGRTNLAFALAKVGTEGAPWDECKVFFYKKVDVDQVRHERFSPSECKLHHSSHIVDVMAHFVQEYDPYLQIADPLLIEQQPPMGLTSIEALLFKEYRVSSIVVSPRAMHSHFGIGHLDYEERKTAVEEIAAQVLQTTPLLLEKYQKQRELGVRSHDVGDAIAYIKMYVDQQKEKWKEKERCKNLTLPGGRIIDWDAYKYRPSKVQKH
jgi:hypothetical protein